MSKKISVKDDVYYRIQRLQGPRETYSQVIDRSLSTIEALQGMSNILGPSHYLKERPKEEVK